MNDQQQLAKKLQSYRAIEFHHIAVKSITEGVTGSKSILVFSSDGTEFLPWKFLFSVF